MKIDAKDVYYRQLNALIRKAAAEGEKEFELDNINGQRYLGTGVEGNVKIIVNGVPGNDMGIFMNGPTIIVNASAQDSIANTMNEGKIVIHGNAGDVLAYAMRGGKLFIKGHVGYRVGIHMKSYKKQIPKVVVGGTAQDFFGEYMAGGVLVLLGLDKDPDQPLVGDYIGTGMHGGVIYIRGQVEAEQLGKEVAAQELNEADQQELAELLQEYCQDLGLDYEEIMKEKFIKLVPVSNRPYGRLYAY